MNAQLQISQGYTNGSLGSPTLSEPPAKWDKLKTFLHDQFTLSKEDGVVAAKPSPPYALLGILAGVLMWIAGATVAGVWTVATMSANIQELRNQNTEEKSRHKEAEAASEFRYQSALSASEQRFASRLTSVEEDNKLKFVYIKDMREALVARGIIKKGNN